MSICDKKEAGAMCKCDCVKEAKVSESIERGVIKPCPFCAKQPDIINIPYGEKINNLSRARCVNIDCPIGEIEMSLFRWQKRRAL